MIGKGKSRVFRVQGDRTAQYFTSGYNRVELSKGKIAPLLE